MRKLLLSMIAIAVLATTAGCMATSAGVAPSSTPIAGKDFTVLGEASGSAFAVNLLGVPLTYGNCTARARNNCVERAAADGIINATVDNKIYNLGLVMVQRTQVSGQAIKFSN